MTAVPHNPAVLPVCRSGVDPGLATHARSYRSDDRLNPIVVAILDLVKPIICGSRRYRWPSGRVGWLQPTLQRFQPYIAHLPADGRRNPSNRGSMRSVTAIMWRTSPAPSLGVEIGLLPGRETTDQRRHVRKAHVEERLGRQGRATTGAAVKDQPLVGIKGFQVGW